MVKDQSKKQIKGLEKHGKQLIKSSGDDSRFEINKLIEKIGFDNLAYYYTSKSARKSFVRFTDPLIIYNEIKNGQIRLQKEDKIQEEL